jgi:hypothetical protein
MALNVDAATKFSWRLMLVKFLTSCHFAFRIKMLHEAAVKVFTSSEKRTMAKYMVFLNVVTFADYSVFAACLGTIDVS